MKVKLVSTTQKQKFLVVQVISHSSIMIGLENSKTVIVFASGFELPRMNYDFNGKKHRFVYGNIVEVSALSNEVKFPDVFLFFQKAQ